MNKSEKMKLSKHFLRYKMGVLAFFLKSQFFLKQRMQNMAGKLLY